MAITLSWHNCYSEGWQNEIVPEAFSHPAKFSRALIRRIYAHALERSYLKEGDMVLDPFGGVALGAADALANGLNFVGVELEQNFVDLGGGCDCTGISKADWVACFGRWKRFAHKDGRHWCPRCLAEAEGVIEPRTASLPGMGPEPTASYERDSGKIPHTEPHRYAGNLDLFVRHARGGATAVLVQGDSRNLVEVLEGARAEGIIASPPYLSTEIARGDVKHSSIKDRKECRANRNWEGYGSDPANLGNMPTGEPPQAVIGSPPYAGSHVGAEDNPYIDVPGGRLGNAKTGHLVGNDNYGDSDGQLAVMREGDVDAVIASPPFASSLPSGTLSEEMVADLRAKGHGPARGSTHNATYGTSDGQLAILPEGDIDAVIASPPFAASQQSKDADFELDSTKANPTPRKLADRSYFPAEMESDGQLAALPEGEPPVGIVSSPPWESSITTANNDFLIIDNRPERKGTRTERLAWGEARKMRDYGSSDGQLGLETGDTFWAASRLILLQCHQVLAPGGVAIWVLKDFIRNKKRVDFTGQWRSLCESCGFETIEVIRAWLVEDRGAQFAFNGDLVERKVARKSFFRRLYEAKARAAKFWESVGRDDKARHLWQAHHDLWENRRSGLPDKKPPYPTRSRILGEAQMMAYAEAGKPDVEIDTQIDWEVVLITRKAA